MALPQSSRLLTLPQELRENIYDFLEEPVKLEPRLVIHTVHPRLKLVCRQISVEIAQRAFWRDHLSYNLQRLPPAIAVNFLGYNANRLVGAHRPLILMTRARMRKGVVKLDWKDITFGNSLRTIGNSAILPRQIQEGYGRTFCRDLCTRTKALIVLCELILTKDAKIRVQLNINGLPDVDIPYYMYPSDKDNFPELGWPATSANLAALLPHRSSLPATLGRMLHVPTIASLATDREDDSDWPHAGNLSVEYTLTTPLYCTIATNGREIKKNQADLQAGRTTEIIQPIFECSEDNVEWVLKLADEDCSASYRGLWPSVVRID